MDVRLLPSGTIVHNLRPLQPGPKTLLLFVQDLCDESYRQHTTDERINLDDLVIGYFYTKLSNYETQGAIPRSEVSRVMLELGKWLTAIIDCSDPEVYAAVCQRDERTYCAA